MYVYVYVCIYVYIGGVIFIIHYLCIVGEMQSANSNKDENSAGGKEKDNTLLEGSTFSMKTDRNVSESIFMRIVKT